MLFILESSAKGGFLHSERDGFFPGDKDKEFDGDFARVHAVVQEINAFGEGVARMKNVLAVALDIHSDFTRKDIAEEGDGMCVPSSLFAGRNGDDQNRDLGGMCVRVFDLLSGKVRGSAQEWGDPDIKVIIRFALFCQK